MQVYYPQQQPFSSVAVRCPTAAATATTPTRAVYGGRDV